MKPVLYVLVLVFCVSLIVGAAGSQEEKITAGQQEIVAILDVIIGEPDGLEAIEKKYKKLTGIAIDIIKPPLNQYGEKLQLSFAAGDPPDVCENGSPLFEQLINEGAIISLDSYLEDSELYQAVPKDVWTTMKSKDGKIYGVPRDGGTGAVMEIRQDWLDNLNLSSPKNWDEFYDTMKAFTENDPDGNGKNDTYGYTCVVGSNGISDDYLVNIAPGAHHAIYKKNDQWVDGFVEPEWKVMTQRLSKLYQDGYVDPEIFTNRTSDLRNKIANGYAGCGGYWTGNWGYRLDKMVKDTNGLNTGLAIVEPFDDGYYWRKKLNPMSISSATADPQMVFEKFLEFMWDGGQGQLLFTHGVEGVHWEMNDGEITHLPFLSRPDTILNKVLILPIRAIRPIHMDDYVYTMPKKMVETRQIWAEHLKPMAFPIIDPKYAQDFSNLETLKVEIFAKIINGELSYTEGMEIYIKRSSEFNIEAILADLNR